MKYKNILLIILFLTLFVFQHVQAGATISSSENTRQINVASASTNILFSTVQVYVYKLVDGSGALLPSHERCFWPGDFGVYGCGDNYPPGTLEPDGYLIVNVEQDYLRDVLATEMNLAQIPPEPEALKAQTMASRSVTSWKSANGPWDDGNGGSNGVWPRINNSNTYQVFIPGAHNTSGYQSAIDAAVDGTTGQFLQYIIGNNHAIDASFGADMELRTGNGDLASAPYLTGVEDPISTSNCFLDVGNNQYGMSQRGTIRWAKGNTCPDGSGAAWPVKWNHQQILVHYYKGVDIVADATGNKVAPDDRWNLLKHNIPTQMNSGSTYPVELWLQNTSTTQWTDAKLIYQWIGTNIPLVEINLPVMPAGEDEKIPVNIAPPSTGGPYTLRLDVKRANGPWFSEQTPLTWPDVEIPVSINGPTATSTPVSQPTSTLPAFTSMPTLTLTNTPTPANMLELVSYTTNFTDPHWDGGGSHTISHWESVAVGERALELHFSFYTVGKTDNSGNIARTAAVIGVKNVGSSSITIKAKEFYRVTGVSSPGIIQLKYFDTGVLNVQAGEYSHDSSVGVTGNQVVYRTIGLGDQWPSTCFGCNYTLEATYDLTIEVLASGTSVCPAKALNDDYSGTSSSGDFKTLFHTVSYIQQALFDLELLYRVRDEILSQTSTGRHYIDLYYGHGVEITQKLRNNSELRDEAIATVQLWETNLQSLVDGQGNTEFISEQEVDAVESFLLNLEAVASSDLSTTIQNEMADLNMQGLVGLTMSQAWEEINGTATPTNTPTNTPTATAMPSQMNTPTLTPTNTPTFTSTPTPTSTPTATPTQANQSLYLSLNNAATLGSISAQDVDILSFNGTTWSMFLDGSDVGINTSSQDINEFHLLDADTILMTFDEPITLGSLAVDPWDVVRFDATSLGENTAGTFSMYLDGNDVGLNTTNEYLDGLHVLPDGRVLLSTTGSPTVSGISGAADEDILAFTPTTLGDVTSGTWSMYFDGPDVGLADSGDEDVDAVAVRSNGEIYLSTSGNFAVTGISGADNDVFICTPTSLGTTTVCNYSTSLYFDGSAYGLDANDVDGIDLSAP